MSFFLAQAGLQPNVEIRGRFARVPFIQQRHGLAKGFQLGGAVAADTQVLLYVGRQPAQAGSQIRHQLANLVALDDCFLHTNSFSCSRKVSYARNSSDLVADSLSFKTSPIWW